MRYYPVGMPEDERRAYDRYLDAIDVMKKNSAHKVTEIQAELLRKGYDNIYVAREICHGQCYIFVRACNRRMTELTSIIGYINAASIDRYGVRHLVTNLERLNGRR